MNDRRFHRVIVATSIALGTISLAPAPPDVVRVKVPAAKVRGWFPKGSELVSIPFAEFEGLVERVRASARSSRSASPMILRALHRARWVNDELVGETILSVRRNSQPGSVVLAPFGLNLETSEGKDFQVRSTDSGEVSLWLAPIGPDDVTLRWRQPARSTSSGRSFTLELPRIPLSQLELDLPDNLTPDHFALVDGPRGGGTVGRKLWRNVGGSGTQEIVLKRSDDSATRVRSVPWVGGPTVVEVGTVSASWRSDWTVEANGAEAPLQVRFSEGLEPIDVSGPGVESFQVERKGSQAIAAIRLRPEQKGPTSIAIRGVAALSAGGAWPVPSAEPIDAVWTGGTTTVRLDRSHGIQDCRVLQGRRIAPKSMGSNDKSLLVFEPERPGTPAELTFIDPRFLLAAEVRGGILLGADKTTLAADLRWSFPRGSMQDLTFDIGDEWSIGTITYEDDPLTWHGEPTKDLRSRIRIVPPTLEGEVATFTIRVNAIRKSSDIASKFEMPRIRPVGVMIEDEIWLAHAEGDRIVQPLDVKGLAWIDPAMLKGNALLPGVDSTLMEHACAWRWTGTGGKFLATIAAAPRETRSAIDGRALIVEGRLRADWHLSIQPGSQPPALIPIFWSIPPTSAVAWTARSLDGQTHSVPTRPLTPSERSAAGFPADRGTAQAILIGGSTSIDLKCAIDQSWTGSEDIPLLSLQETFGPIGRFGVEVDRNLRLKIDAKKLDQVNEIENSGTAFPDDRDSFRSALRPVTTFEYAGSYPELRLETSTPLQRSPSSIIRSARLETDFTGSGSRAEHLSLVVAPGDSTNFAVRMPPRSRIQRVLRDGRPVVVTTAGPGVLVPFDPANKSNSTALVIEYETSGTPSTDDLGRFYPELPMTETPCLNFTWLVSLPKHWTMTAHGQGLGAIGVDARSELESLLKQGAVDLRKQPIIASGITLDSLLNAIQQFPVAETKLDSIRLREWLSYLDVKSTPILVDVVGAARIDLAFRNLDSKDYRDGWTRQASPSRLERGDTCLIALANAVVLTDRDGDLVRRLREQTQTASILASVESALINSVDSTGRFVSIDLWRGRGRDQSAPELIASSTAQMLVFRTQGWPGPNAWFEVEQPRRTVAKSLMLAILITFTGFLLSRRSRRARNRLTAVVLAGTIVTLVYGTSVPPWIRVGLTLGAFGLVVTAIMPARQRALPGPERRSTRSASRWATLSIMIVLLAIGNGAAPPSHAIDGETPPQPILAILPYEGGPDLDRPPDRVVVLLSDLERLRAAADPVINPGPERLQALASSHRVSLEPDGFLHITSEFILVHDGAKSGEWRVPTEAAWDIRSTVDGLPFPVRMVDEGRVAVISLQATGTHRLVLDRTVRPRVSGSLISAEVPINPVPACRFDVSSQAALGRIRVEALVPRIPFPPNRLAGDFGATRQFVVEFRNGAEARAGDSKAGYTAMALWDVRPSGDLVRMKVKSVHDESVSTLKFTLQPGTEVRLPDAARLSSQRWGGTTAKPEWVATFDPPYRAVDEILVEFWRPITLSDRPVRGSLVRQSPRIGVGDGVPFSGVLAFRRPSDWSGRLSARSGFDALDEESFVKAWGPLPDEPFTLSGARGFQGVAAADVATGPIVSRLSVKPSTTLELGEGRVDALIEAELKDPRELTTDLDIDVPPDLILDQFAAEGLVRMSRPERGRIHVELRAIEKPIRKLTFRGHRLVDPSQEASTGRRYQCNIPWPSWRRIDEEPGLLTIISTTKPQVSAGPSVSPVALVAPPVAVVPASLVRTLFQVGRSADLGMLSWNAASPLVSVHLVSRLDLDELAARLHTTIRYVSSRGPIEELFLQIPTVWVHNIGIELVGNSFQRTTESRGAWTFLTLRPKQPIWGAASLRLRSSRNITPGVVIAYPDVMPLGQGSAEKILSVERRTVAPIEIEGSSGLQSIDLSRVPDVNFTDTDSAPVEAYRVKGDAWSLNLRVGGDPKATQPPGSSHVRSGEVYCRLQRDGSHLGYACLFIDGRRGSSLRVRLGPRSEVVWCKTNGKPVVAHSDESGSWLVPVYSNGDGVVELYWSTSKPQSGLSASRIEFPRVDHSEEGFLLRVDSDPDHVVSSESTLVEEIKAPIWLLDRAERTARRLVGMIGQYDRTSIRQERMIRSLFLRYKREATLTRRSAEAFTFHDPSTTVAFRDQVRSRLDKTQSVVTDSQLANGLDDPTEGRSLIPARLDAADGQSELAGIGPNAPRYFRVSPVIASEAWGLDSSARSASPWSRIDRWLAIGLAAAGLLVTPQLSRWRIPRARFTLVLIALGLIILASISPIAGLVMLWSVALGMLDSKTATGPVTPHT
jgi:hypothetical protein